MAQAMDVEMYNLLRSQPTERPLIEDSEHENDANSSDSASRDLELDVQDHPLHNTTVIPDLSNKDLVFSPYYYILRHSRTLHRSEVLGFGFVSVVIMCIAMQAQLGLEAVGFFVPVTELQQTQPHPVHSFSWKILSEFLLTDSISNAEKDCLFYFNKKRFFFKYRNMKNVSGGDNYGDQDDFMEQLYNEMVMLEDELLNSGNGSHRTKCSGRGRIPDEWTWFCKYVFSMTLPLLNLCCAIFLLSCVRCRRKKGFQFTLMLPTFLTVFLDIFQQVPMIFQYSYTGITLADDMNNAMTTMMSLPIFTSPIWEETQLHGQCCGIQSPQTWRNSEYDVYPISCCNTTAHNCDAKIFPTKNQVWDNGCYKQEYDKIRFYEFYTMLNLLLKLFAEMGILWCLSDLTRYDYPRPEQQLNASCDVQDFEIRTKGCITILGVTDRQIMALKMRKFQPGKYTFKIIQIGTLKTINIKTTVGHVGSIEIRRQRRNRNTENAKVDLEQGRHEGLVFISFQ